jgi:hypothetical protein
MGRHSLNAITVELRLFDVVFVALAQLESFEMKSAIQSCGGDDGRERLGLRCVSIPKRAASLRTRRVPANEGFCLAHGRERIFRFGALVVG